MKYLIAFFAIASVSFTSYGLTSGGTSLPSTSPTVSAVQTVTVPRGYDLVIDRTGYSSGVYHLQLTVHEDGSASLGRQRRMVLNFDGDLVDGPTFVPDEPDDPEDPDDEPEPADPDLSVTMLVIQVETNYMGDTESFNKIKNGLKLSLYVTPGETLLSAHSQIQKWFKTELGTDADKWTPWLAWFNEPLVSGEIDNLADFQQHVDLARRSL